MHACTQFRTREVCDKCSMRAGAGGARGAQAGGAEAQEYEHHASGVAAAAGGLAAWCNTRTECTSKEDCVSVVQSLTRNLTKPKSAFWVPKPRRSKMPRMVSHSSSNSSIAFSKRCAHKRLLSSRGLSPTWAYISKMESSTYNTFLVVGVTMTINQVPATDSAPSTFRIMVTSKLPSSPALLSKVSSRRLSHEKSKDQERILSLLA